MKLRHRLAAVAVAGGCAAFVLRLAQNRTGFEPVTGLPIPGSAASLALLALLAVLTVILGALAAALPKKAEPAFPADFTAQSSALLTLPVAGSLLMALSGVADLAEGLGAGSLLTAVRSGDGSAYVLTAALGSDLSALSARTQLLTGALTLFAAAGLLLSAAACRRGGAFQRELLLPAPAALVVRLVLIYRIDSIDPVLWDYVVELLALVFLTLGFYRLSSFAFGGGRTGRFAFCAGEAVVLCLCALADGSAYLSSLLLYAGGALTLLGFLLLHLSQVPVVDAPETDEPPEADAPAV